MVRGCRFVICKGCRFVRVRRSFVVRVVGFRGSQDFHNRVSGFIGLLFHNRV